MHNWLMGLVIAALVIGVVVKRLIGEPLSARDLWAPPVVLTGLGLWSLVKAGGLTGTDFVWVTVLSALGFGLGALRGRTIEVFERRGVAWQRYTGRTFLVAAASLALMAGFGFVAVRTGMHEHARPMELSLGISFLGEASAVSLRALASGLPFAVEGASR